VATAIGFSEIRQLFFKQTTLLYNEIKQLKMLTLCNSCI
jgi:hypothetical protein